MNIYIYAFQKISQALPVAIGMIGINGNFFRHILQQFSKNLKRYL